MLSLRFKTRREERQCRFCEMELPDWRIAYEHFPRADPLMTVVRNGRVYVIKVQVGLRPSGVHAVAPPPQRDRPSNQAYAQQLRVAITAGAGRPE
jgi:hypothetical protein